MSIGLIIITHGNVGASLLESATQMFGGNCPLRVANIAVWADDDPDALLVQAREAMAEVNDGEGVLILTDIFGGTPSNVAYSLANGECISVISGINLPMLVRVLNYPQLAATELTQKAVSGGRDGIFSTVAKSCG